jgi:hypothetical protein
MHELVRQSVAEKLAQRSKEDKERFADWAEKEI